MGNFIKKTMGENPSGKWYKNPAIIAVIITGVATIIAAIISGVFAVISAFISNGNDTPVQPLPPIQSEPPAPVQEVPVESQAGSIKIFQDDFEGRLRQWRTKRDPGYYNDSMRWHRSDKVSFSGKYSLSLGHEDTDRKDNNDVVHIETKEDFLLTEDSLLSFQIKKEYRINLKIVLKDKDAPFKDTVIKFYPGNKRYKDWRAEKIPLGSDIDEGRYTLILKAWDQGSLYVDDIKIQN